MAKGSTFDFSEPPSSRVPVLDKGSLHRILGSRHLFAIGYGDVGSSIYYALGVTTLYALGAAPLALALAGIVFFCTVLTYAELSAAMPESGSGMLEELPALRAAEAIAIGEGVPVHLRIIFDPLPEDCRPHSNTAKFSDSWDRDDVPAEFLTDVVSRWRRQR